MDGHTSRSLNGGDQASLAEGSPPATDGAGPALPAWSASAMIERLGDEDLVRQLVALFLAEYPKLLRGLHDSLSAGNPDSVRRAAHAAKGCIANFVEGGAQATAYEIERLGADGRLEEIAPLLARLEREVVALAAAMCAFAQAGPACES